MFLCPKCAPKYGCRNPDVHFGWSHGPCEGCRRTTLCVDCHCPPKKKAKSK